MNIKERLLNEMKTALKQNDTIAKNTIQLMRASILSAEKNKQDTLTQLEIENVLLKEKGKRYDALAQFKLANRQDLVQQTEREIYIISQYLPQPLSEIELEEIVDKEIQASGAKDIRDMGTVIRHIKEQYGSRVVPTLLSEIVKKKLTKE